MIRSIIRSITNKDDHKLYPKSSAFPKRYDIINFLINKFKLTSYLEIGCRLDGSFKEVDVLKKYGIDPSSGGTHRMTSDEFFSTNNEKYDVIFIDGLHWSEQVEKDIDNALLCLNDGGYIVAHDCLPKKESHQMYPIEKSISQKDNYQNLWLGDSWIAVARLNNNDSVQFVTIDTDFGCSVIRKGKSNIEHIDNKDLNFDYFSKNSQTLMNVVTDSEFKDWVR